MHADVTVYGQCAQTSSSTPDSSADRKRTNTMWDYISARNSLSAPDTILCTFLQQCLDCILHAKVLIGLVLDTTQRPRWQNRNYASLIIITYKLCRCRKIVVDFFVCAVGVVTRCHHTVCQQIIIFALRLFLSHNTRWGAFLLFRFCFVRRLHWQIRTYTICSLSPLSIFTFFHSDSLEMEERKKKKKSFCAFS